MLRDDDSPQVQAASAPDQARRGRGRPRDGSMEPAIMQAGWALLAERGYAGMTFEDLAERAGCSRPALYRRFANKRELIIWMLDNAARDTDPALPAHVPPRTVLIENLWGFVRHLGGPAGVATPELSQARRRDPELSVALDALYERERRPYLVALDAALKGALPAPEVSGLVDNMIGAVLFRAGLQGQKLKLAQIEQIVDQALLAGRASLRKPRARQA
ncbi:helix-turn-helix domain-containing protein [Phenylobacterium sp.]|uniref:TetR/AcrR family transcriptional regulator n=1 Tax=Phenylobacterium sp. TaxID=1871053 RepID=UPI0028983D8E|nr:helix-turn-helix domain-containing protein [Phenylobacterium sp.]